MENPWEIDSIYELQYFNCPSCLFKDHSKQEIVNHAYEFHPNSIHHLDNIKDESLIDVICPWSVQEIKKEESNLENIETVDHQFTPQVQIKTEEKFDDFSEDPSKDDDDNMLTSDSCQELIDQKITCKGCEELFEINEIQKHILQIGHCKEQYTLADINQLKKLSKERKKAKDKLYYQANKEKLKEGGRKYYQLNKDKFKERQLLQSQQQNHICNLCGKTFANSGNLNKHVKSIHEGIKICKKGVCDTCGKEFSTPFALKKHVKIVHEGVKDQECKYCGKVFGDTTTLRNHVKSIHEKIKDHSCEICGKSFTFSYSLKEHINSVHEREGVKDISCDICGQGFKKAKSLKLHIKYVHDKIKNYKCQYCGKAFSTVANLQTHIKCVHEKRRDFACETCGKAFFQQSNLNHHIKAIHENPKNTVVLMSHSEFLVPHRIQSEKVVQK